MPLQGDMQALSGFLRGIRKLPDACKEIARKLSPRVTPLVQETITAQQGPFGQGWPATKSGAPAFSGSDVMGRVLSRVVGGTTVRTTVLYPLHFHQGGTRRIGKKRGRRIGAQISGGYERAVLSQMGLGAANRPRRRKGESDAAYTARLAKFEAARTTRKEARLAARRHAAAAIEQARAAGGWHDPPRPMIPEQDDPIPPRWEDTIRQAAREVMTPLGATERA